MSFIVVYDACVLYPAPLRDLLLELAISELFAAKWTNTIHLYVNETNRFADYILPCTTMWEREDVPYVSLLGMKQIMAIAKERLGSVKAPKSVEFVDGFPRTPIGKIDKKVLRAAYWEGQAKKI